MRDRSPRTLILLPSRTKTTLDTMIRSPTFLSRADAEPPSSEKSDLSSYIDNYQEEQLQSLSLLKEELIPFFDLWDKLQSLNTTKYKSFCSLFYLNLSDDFITTNAEGFLDSDPSKSGEFILKQINTTISKILDIYSLISDRKRNPSQSSIHLLQRQQTFTTSETHKQEYEVISENKQKAIVMMEKFSAYYLIHLQLGIHETMFDESCNALEKSIDSITKNKLNPEYEEIGEFTLSERGGLRIFFEITRALMLQQDLSEVQGILNGINQRDKIQNLIQNEKLVQKFIAFWDGMIWNDMTDTEKQLFSLRIYSHMIKRLQDYASGIYYDGGDDKESLTPSVENTDKIVLMDSNNNKLLQHSRSTSLAPPTQSESVALVRKTANSYSALTGHSMSTTRANSKVNFENISTDQLVMEQFHFNDTFVTTFSIGIISWLNYLISFLKQNQPKKLFIHLRNIKRTYKRMNIDMMILKPLLYAFKSSCIDNEHFYIEDKRNMVYKSLICIIDEELEECIDYVFSLFLEELIGFRKQSSTTNVTDLLDLEISHTGNNKLSLFTQSAIERKSTYYDASSQQVISPRGLAYFKSAFDDNIGPGTHEYNFNSPLISPKKKLHQNVNSSLIFWKANSNCESST